MLLFNVFMSTEEVIYLLFYISVLFLFPNNGSILRIQNDDMNRTGEQSGNLTENGNKKDNYK